VLFFLKKSKEREIRKPGRPAGSKIKKKDEEELVPAICVE
jgi:hypothetical protein